MCHQEVLNYWQTLLMGMMCDIFADHVAAGSRANLSSQGFDEVISRNLPQEPGCGLLQYNELEISSFRQLAAAAT
jgi:hypothetical protein